MSGYSSKKILELTETTLLDNVSLALVLASAIAWNEVIKTFTAKFIKNGGGEWYVFLYAVFLTFLMVVFQMLSKRSTTKIALQ